MADSVHYSIVVSDNKITAVKYYTDKKSITLSEGLTTRFDSTEDMLDALQQLLGDADFESGSCHLALGPEFFIFRSLTVPFEDSKQVASVLSFEIQDSVSLNEGEYIYDYTKATDGEGSTKVFAVLIRKKLITSLLATLQEYELDPEVLTVTTIPRCSNIYRSRKWNDSPFVLVHMGITYGSVSIVNEGEVTLIRSIPVDPQKKAGLELSDDSDKVSVVNRTELRTVLRDFCRQVQNTILAAINERDQTYSKVEFYFTGDMVRSEEQQQLLAELLGVTGQEKDEPIFTRLQGVNEFSIRYRIDGYSENLALGEATSKDLHTINFRKDEFARQHDRGRFYKILRNTGIGAAAAGIIAVIGLTLDFNNLKHERDMLVGEINEIYRSAVPGNGKIVNPVQQLQVKVNELKNATSAGSSSDPAPNTLMVLGDISERVPEDLEVRFERLIYDRKTIRIKGLTDNFNTVDQMKRYLDKSPYYTEVAIVSANVSAKDNGVRFELKLQI